MGELLIILVIVMLVFGAGKLPAIGDALGRSIKNFKRAANGHDEIEVNKNAELGSKSSRELGDGDYADVVAKRAKASKSDE
jgi:sec-independent protein translocase protein TatA